MDIGRIFTRSWEIVWNNKVLWIFGILAGCGSRNPSSGFFGGSNYDTGPGDVQNLPPEMRQAFEEMVSFFSNSANSILFFLTVAVIVFVLFLVTLLVGSIGKAGVIKGVLQVEEGKTLEGFGQLWEASAPYMLRVLGLNLGIGIVLFLGLSIVIILFVVFSIFTFGLGFLLICILLPALLIGGVFVSIFIEQANVAVVAEDTSVGAAIGRSWEIIRGNKGNVIGVGVLILIFRAIVMIGFGMVFLFTAFGIFISVFASGASEVMGLIWGMLALGLMISIVYMLVNGVLTTYTGTAWTLVYNGAAADMAPIGVDEPMLEEKNTGDDDEGVIVEL